MGSRAGSPNKNRAFVLKKLQEIYGKDFHPVLEMADIAAKEKEKGADGDRRLQFDAVKELAQYVMPKLRSVEVSGTLGVHELSDEQLDAELKRLVAGG